MLAAPLADDPEVPELEETPAVALPVVAPEAPVAIVVAPVAMSKANGAASAGPVVKLEASGATPADWSATPKKVVADACREVYGQIASTINRHVHKIFIKHS